MLKLYPELNQLATDLLAYCKDPYLNAQNPGFLESITNAEKYVAEYAFISINPPIMFMCVTIRGMNIDLINALAQISLLRFMTTLRVGQLYASPELREEYGNEFLRYEKFFYSLEGVGILSREEMWELSRIFELESKGIIMSTQEVYDIGERHRIMFGIAAQLLSSYYQRFVNDQ